MTPKSTADLRHKADTRTNIPSAEDATTMSADDRRAIPYYYDRNHDLDPQLVWRGKDDENDTPLEVMAPPIYVQERIRPKAIIDDLRRHSDNNPAVDSPTQMFADFNGLPSPEARTEFYQHQANWSNRMILGDSLQVMASLAEKEGLKGQVQCIYMDPPYGINFSSNWQWSTNKKAVGSTPKDITREPEQIKAFRDTWSDGIHSYLSYLRDRLIMARELLTESGSIFVQMGDENVHRVRALMDEVFGDENFVTEIVFAKATAQTSRLLSNASDYIIWFTKSKSDAKYNDVHLQKVIGQKGATGYTLAEAPDGSDSRSLTPEELAKPSLIPRGMRVFTYDHLRGTRSPNPTDLKAFQFEGNTYNEDGDYVWKTDEDGLRKLGKAGRLVGQSEHLSYKRYFNDFTVYPMTANWTDTSGATNKRYVVETAVKPIQRCILMTTDPGDLVLDPTCGAGTTAYVAEQWGRRWITMDTSRVALALARSRLMGARYPYYLLEDSPEGVAKRTQIERGAPPQNICSTMDVRQGFVYRRVPHITLAAIANNAEIDIIWERYQEDLEPLRELLNEACGTSYEEWEIPREPEPSWTDEARLVHAEWWEQRLARQREIDASIAANADYEYLYDKPYEDSSKVRVAGPFTVESVSPHRMLPADDGADDTSTLRDTGGHGDNYTSIILDNLRVSGVQQAHKGDRITFSNIDPWAGSQFISAQGQCNIGDNHGTPQRAAIFIGPEFGTVTRPDLVEAAREGAEAGFDMLVACAFQYDAQTTEMSSYGRITVLQARMNADLHMATDLKPSERANLFVVFGEPDIELQPAPDSKLQVKINGVDVYDPTTGNVRSDNTDGIAMWFIDTDYNSECFFVRHAYFLGAQDPYERLKTSLKSEINLEAWDTLNSDTSRPFNPPSTGRIAVKVINHLGDEVMKVLRVPRD